MELFSVLIAGGALLVTVLGGGLAWFGGIRVLKFRVEKLSEAVEKLNDAQDSSMAVRVTAIEKWIDTTGNADQVRAWGHIKELVPELKKTCEDQEKRLTALEHKAEK